MTNDKVVCCTKQIDGTELSLGIPLQEIKLPELSPHHYLAITVSVLLLMLGVYELMEYYGIKVRADSFSELLCSPAQDSASCAEFFCFFLYATDKRKAA